MNMYTPEEQRLYEAVFRNPRLTESNLAESLSDDRPVSRRLIEKVTVLLSNRGLPKSRDRVVLISELELTLLKLVREQAVTTLSGLVDAYSQAWAATESAGRMPAPLLASFLSVRLGLKTDQDLHLYRMAASAESWTDGAAPARYWSFLVRIALLSELKRTRAAYREIQDEMVRRLSSAAKLSRDKAQEFVVREIRALLIDSHTGVVASVVRPLDIYPDFTPILGTAVYPDKPDKPEHAARTTDSPALEQRLAALEKLVAGLPDYADLLRRVTLLEQQLAPAAATPPVQQDVVNDQTAALNEELQRVRAERDQAAARAQQLETVGLMLERQVADLQARLQAERRQAIVDFLSDLAGERSHYILGQLHRTMEHATARSHEALVSLIRTLLNGLYRQGLTPYLPDNVAVGQKVSGRPEQLVRTYQPDASVVMVGQTGEMEAVVAAFGWKFGDEIIARPLITSPDKEAV